MMRGQEGDDEEEGEETKAATGERDESQEVKFKSAVARTRSLAHSERSLARTAQYVQYSRRQTTQGRNRQENKWKNAV